MGGIFHSQITIRNAQISTIDIHVYILFNELFNMYIYIYINTVHPIIRISGPTLGPRSENRREYNRRVTEIVEAWCHCSPYRL